MSLGHGWSQMTGVFLGQKQHQQYREEKEEGGLGREEMVSRGA